MSTKPEQHLKVGDWWYLPEQDKLVKFTDAGEIVQTAELDNLCQKALNYFIMNAGRLVTRDELLSDVWGVRDVSDGRISRVIRVLRVELGDDSREPTYIETIPKRGFRFVAAVVAVASTTQEVPPEVDADVHLEHEVALPSSAKRSLKSYVLWSSVAAVLCCSMIYFGWLHWGAPAQLEHEVPFGRLEPISSMDGLEFYPSTSADGRYLAYSHLKALDGTSSLVVQDTKTLEKKVLKSVEDQHLFGPQFHPNGQSIVYQILKRKAFCEIRQMTFDDKLEVLTDSLLTSCNSSSMGARMGISPDGKYLVYPDWQEKSGNIAIMLLPFDGGKIEQLTTPPEASLGDFAASFSPDGTSVSFIRDVAGSAGQIWVMRLNDRSIQMLLQPEGIYPGQVAWMQDSQEILFPSGNNELASVNVTSKKLRTFAYTDSTATEVVVDASGRIYCSVGKLWQSSIRKLNNPLKNPIAVDEVMQQASRSEGMLELNPLPDGPTAVMSNRSGVQQVWLYFKDGRQKQISRFSGDFIPKTLEFSPDGKHLLVLVGTSIWLLSEDSEPQLLSRHGQDSRDPSWSHDSKTIYFSTSEQGRWRVIAMSMLNLEQKVLAMDMDFFRESPDGTYQVWRSSSDKKLFMRTPNNPDKIIDLSEQSGFTTPFLVLRKTSIYYVKKVNDRLHEIYSYELKTGKSTSTGIASPKYARRFSVSIDEKFILQDDGKTGDIDIAQLVFSKPFL
jgi:transcriptional activator of cad operon